MAAHDDRSRVISGREAASRGPSKSKTKETGLGSEFLTLVLGQGLSRLSF